MLSAVCCLQIDTFHVSVCEQNETHLVLIMCPICLFSVSICCHFQVKQSKLGAYSWSMSVIKYQVDSWDNTVKMTCLLWENSQLSGIMFISSSPSNGKEGFCKVLDVRIETASLFNDLIHIAGVGALQYERDVHVPNEEQKCAAFFEDFIEKGSYLVWAQKKKKKKKKDLF